ncbi:hypothetical protein B7463_g12080, partial [Scytalidium lignicola]
MNGPLVPKKKLDTRERRQMPGMPEMREMPDPKSCQADACKREVDAAAPAAAPTTPTPIVLLLLLQLQ